MVEARRLKAGRWRIYRGSDLQVVRDPATRLIVAFDSLDTARHWWRQLHPGDPPLQEAIKCVKCGGYFGVNADWVESAGRHYHLQHAPPALAAERHQPVSAR